MHLNPVLSIPRAGRARTGVLNRPLPRPARVKMHQNLVLSIPGAGGAGC